MVRRLLLPLLPPPKSGRDNAPVSETLSSRRLLLTAALLRSRQTQHGTLTPALLSKESPPGTLSIYRSGERPTINSPGPQVPEISSRHGIVILPLRARKGRNPHQRLFRIRTTLLRRIRSQEKHSHGARNPSNGPSHHRLLRRTRHLCPLRQRLVGSQQHRVPLHRRVLHSQCLT